MSSGLRQQDVELSLSRPHSTGRLGHPSDSDVSAESNSPSPESTTQEVAVAQPTGRKKKRRKKVAVEWEILEGLKDGQRYEGVPIKNSGHMMKKRKWPLKGWHKRYFILEKGILTYGKSPGDLSRGKTHGAVDVGLSVISTKTRRRRIDIDAEEFIYHLKVKSHDEFIQWMDSLKHHRLYRQHLIAHGDTVQSAPSSPELMTAACPLSPVSGTPRERYGSLRGGCRSPTMMRVSSWLMDSGYLSSSGRELTQIQQQLDAMSKLLDQLQYDHSEVSDVSPNLKKERKRFLMRKKKPSKTEAPPPVSPNKQEDMFSNHVPGNLESLSGFSTSNPSLPTTAATFSMSTDQEYPRCASDSSSTSTHRQEYYVLAKEVLESMRTLQRNLHTERDRMRQFIESENLVALTQVNSSMASTLKSSLNQALQQNQDLRNKLLRIHNESDVSEVGSSNAAAEVIHRTIHPSFSYDSGSCISTSEYFDAQEYHQQESDNSSSDEGSSSCDDDSFTSENSDTATEFHPLPHETQHDISLEYSTGRRTKLPCPKPKTEELSLWNLLKKNIGKDLSKVAMPVTLNEPLSLLQKLCEELEYSELLDKAADTPDPMKRMILVAAFAVSGFSSLFYRAGHKPFNPLLGETYECIRADKGFRFIAEQVSHHPPVSVCHAESKNFVFLQDLRVRTKFWGKSMEFQPLGTVEVRLPRFNEHYRWNKVTTCVHNILSGTRWADLYGEMIIQCKESGITTKMEFVKASSWSSKRYEVYGTVSDTDGSQEKLHGRWNEAVFAGSPPKATQIWRAGTMPADCDLYYGFTRFAIELNELDPEMTKYLPSTDTRFRPDQRFLEEGNVSAAENMKLHLEQAQRDRKKQREDDNEEYHPRWFRRVAGQGNEEAWEFNKEYWQCRKNPGFMNMRLETLWQS